jgi:hypothetical protein
MQVQRKNENGVESNCLLLILLMILNFFGVLLEIKLLKRGKLLNFEFIKVSWLTMEKCLSDELNNKMTNLKSSISEHAIEQVQKKTRRLCLVRVFQGGRNARQLEPVQQALAEFERKKLIDIEYIDIDKVKTQHLTVQSIVQWLLSSDVHLIITHMHQGIMELLGWNMIDLI